jgi:DNA-binding MarR family transcriptional regulator
LYDYQIPDARLAAWSLLFQAFYATRKAEDRKLAKAKVGLTHEKLAILQLATLYEDPLTPAEISRSLFRESQTIAAMLSRMEREGLVKRVPKRKGKPFTEVIATAKGKELCGPAVEETISFATELMSCLSAEELEQLLELLRKIRQKALDQLYIELLPPPQGPCRWLEEMG